ncbi:UDP-glucose/GDP-mannose dehydrogenase family protein [Bacillus sp. 03113]|uniref:UDP-glucose dehydrogenase family protein n=1 Tax=Bacillus sp. 03113 TaxID=2578211 RepID=UPI0011441F97|nr:UDP-glucose/GDP-mannose dehydrogenase family protein [Bacillus sp. 03113]
MKIAVVGTGYVGLVTGVCLSEVGHVVTCIDIDKEKVEKLNKGISPIFEPGLEDLMIKNMNEERLYFTSSLEEGFKEASVIYIAVGTPEKEDGSANLSYVEAVAKSIAKYVKKDVVVVTKSTVPVGTNDKIYELIMNNLENKVNVDVASNPEFLREGSAIKDSFQGDRIVIGTRNEGTAGILEEINKPFGIPIFKTNIRSAEVIKYASNAFLATKISFINEISNICERVNANVEDVALGMGLDSRVGSRFLNAGIGYGGSCFPKDTKALVQIAGNVKYDFELLKGVIIVNQKQQGILLDKLEKRFTSLEGKRIAILGLAFKPNTDDMREAASIVITNKLIKQNVSIVAYDPIAMDNAKKVLNSKIEYALNTKEALDGADAALILTEWEEFKELDLDLYLKYMRQPIVFDGRNCYDLEEVKNYNIEYYSMGRPSIKLGVLEKV